MESFRRRNLEVTTLIGKRINSARVEGATPKLMTAHSKRVKSAMAEHNIQVNNIYNMNETGTALGASANTVVLGSSTKKIVRVKAPGDCE
jgi:hypothetical protein